MSGLRVTWRKSAIGYARDQKATIAALGLRRLNHSVEHEDTPSIRGMVFKVRHLVDVDGMPADSPAGAQRLARTGTAAGAGGESR
ncbi:MAG TPA: 50S ribosomal protein L30 [Candidatus Dormibacteraeota bacterium]|nr:50S ribosomal protein L30 [Candidatus Dormibacteraeota bacterium]